ncbi:uncharacterized protein LOC132904354 [Amyelois transitella]|uniref:uncharacterized protein LOC132904354 n=1 Tax=Amyelois transitella TaxID=680683 RepID=UPI00298FC7CB|nr:uncharacterized protein LOC132904354 [Amyelois transitella]
METDYKSRKQVNIDQMQALIGFLKEHPELAKGLIRGRRGKLHTLKLWNLCAKKLNLIQNGAVKDGKGWSKYWCDWKYRVRRRTLELKAAKDSNRPPPDGVTPLSYLEEDILDIIGETNVEGVIIKCDPLGDGDTDNEPESNDVNVSVSQVPQPSINQTKSSRVRKRRHSSLDIFDVDDNIVSSSPEIKPKVMKKENTNNTDMDEETSEFLRLERQKLDNSKKMCETIQAMASEITRLADVMTHIRDVLINGRVNIA